MAASTITVSVTVPKFETEAELSAFAAVVQAMVDLDDRRPGMTSEERSLEAELLLLSHGFGSDEMAALDAATKSARVQRALAQSVGPGNA